MINYAKFGTNSDLKSRTGAHDVLSDMKTDLDGLQLTLMAIMEQPSVIEPCQLSALSDMAFCMAQAIEYVMESVDAECRGKGGE